MKYRYFIGLDVGGTFTRGTIIDVEGNLRYDVKDLGANPAVMPREKVIEIISHIIGELVSRVQGSTNEVACIGVGSAGVGKGYWRDLFVKAAEENGISGDRVCVYEDYRVALVACFLFQPGILYIAGTGSVTYGVYNDKEVKVGGWGHLLDDAGSAYQVGRDGIEAALRSIDGRGKKTILAEKLVEYLKLRDVGEVIPKIYGSPNPKKLIAGFAPYVLQAYIEGDEVAKEIIDKCISEMALAIVTAAKKLNYISPQIAIIGGFWEGSRKIIEPKLRKILEERLGKEIIVKDKVIDTTCASILMACRDLDLLTNELYTKIVKLCKHRHT